MRRTWNFDFSYFLAIRDQTGSFLVTVVELLVLRILIRNETRLAVVFRFAVVPFLVVIVIVVKIVLF